MLQYMTMAERSQRHFVWFWLANRVAALALLDRDDEAQEARDEPSVEDDEAAGLEDKIAKLKEEMQRLKELESQRLAAPDKQISETDPDARSIATRGRGSGIVGYNVQTAVDAEHHLIVAHAVTNAGTDRDQLSQMAERARSVMGADKLDVVADRGYFKGEEILACHDAGITAFVAKPLTSSSKADGRFGKQDFRYIPEEDAYLCPAGERLIRRFATEEKGKTLHVYWSSACQACSIKPQCTTAKQRRIKRWEHEGVLDAMQRRLDREPDKMRLRRQTVEHPYGTIKSWMGSTHFLTKTLDRVGTEMSLHVLAYNLKRIVSIIGVGPLIQAMRA